MVKNKSSKDGNTNEQVLIDENKRLKEEISKIPKELRKINITFQERRRILDILNEIPQQEKYIEFKFKDISLIKEKLNNKNLTSEDVDKFNLDYEINESQLRKAVLNLIYLKEDLTNLLIGHDYPEVLKQLKTHISYIEKECKTIQEALTDVVQFKSYDTIKGV